jgi:predicted RNA binding protein YcfA (HicA-like mRNA interferase family)
MLAPETDTRKIVAHLKREGWTSVGGAKHGKCRHPGKPGKAIIVPRHATITPGVARNIAKAAGWK